MSRVLHSIHSTINGCCHHEHVVANEEHHAYAADLIDSADALLFGRHSFDLLEAFWPSAAERSDLPRHVVRFAKIAADAEPRLFSRLGAPIRFPLIDVRAFESGVLLARYGRKT
ncbi:MAG: hypothetical protein ACREV5_04055 [Steroidobacter sp.]